MSESQLAVLPPQQIIDVAKHALSIDAIVAQRDLIKSCMAKAMEEGQHYGRVPGCGDKPTLLQPGAQLLAHLFRLRPEYEIIETDLLHDHKRFRVTCRLYVMGSTPPIPISEGVGESSSMESKHRFRNAAPVVTPTGDPVPSKYWDIKNKDGAEAAKKWAANAYDGKHVSTKKIDGSWQFVIVEGGSDEKVENTNPSDVFNTVLKIAKKRAFVDATITATASSDFFTQDLEDIRDNVEATKKEEKTVNGHEVQQPAPRSESRPPAQTNGTSDMKGWRDVECTFGTKNGPLRGKKLGDLNESNLKYLCEMFLAEGKKIDAKDQKMVAGLAMWKASQSAPKTKGRSNSDGFNGPNHSQLAELLAWENPEISQDDFLEAMKNAGHIPAEAKSFMAMSDETAKTFLGEYEDAKEIVRVYLAKKETPAS